MPLSRKPSRGADADGGSEHSLKVKEDARWKKEAVLINDGGRINEGVTLGNTFAQRILLENIKEVRNVKKEAGVYGDVTLILKKESSAEDIGKERCDENRR